MKALLLILLLPLHMLAQDLSGIWTGYLQTTDTRLPYELVVTSGKNGVSGYSLTVFTINGVENVGVKSMKLKSRKERLTLEDDELLYNNFSTPPRKVKLLADLSLQQTDSGLVLAGSFFTRSLDFRATGQNLYKGTVHLQKQQDNTVSTKLIARLEEMNLRTSLSFALPPDEKTTAAVNDAALPAVKDRELTIGKTQTPVAKASPQVLQPQLKEPLPEETFEMPTLKETIRRMATTPPLYVKAAPKQLRPTLKEVPPPSIIYLASPEPSQQPKAVESTVVLKATPAKDTLTHTVTQQKPLRPTTSIATAPTLPPGAAIAAVDLSKRKTEIIRSVPFTSDSLVLSLYDNGTIDGDTVSVVLNGRVIIAKSGLTANAIRTTIHITPETGDSLQLVMYAENLGSIPPNTGLLVIQDGEIRNEIRFAGDMQKSSAIVLRRRR